MNPSYSADKRTRLASVLGMTLVTFIGILLAACQTPSGGGGPPAPPNTFTLQVPNDAFGANFAGTQPAIAATASAPASYFVLPLLTNTAPIVRALFSSPYPSDLVVTATDVSRGQSITLPQIPRGTPGPSTGFFQVVSVRPENPTTWLIEIRYPNSFQGSKAINTSISDVVSGVASAPLTFGMRYRGSMVSVSIASENGDGRVTSAPAGIDCPGVCSADFLNTTSVVLTQSVTHNQTQFTGWMGNCSANGNSCTVQLLANGPGIIPVNSTVTANFRVHTNSAIPPAMSCPPAPLVPGKRWVAQPNCGNVQFANLQCDGQGYFCCGGQTGTSTSRCNGQNQTGVTCSTSPIAGGPVNQLLIQPGGCYENDGP